MTEHPTSPNERQATSPAAGSGAHAPEDAHGAVPDPRTAVRRAAAPGQEPDGGRPRPAFPTSGQAGGPTGGQLAGRLKALIPLLHRKEDRSWRKAVESEVREWNALC
ncbi:hypothetical protein ABT174_12550, partial [Streptomyces sparsogenes]|uniref:hypothetical protein n=1 Tax=Streptomyces sparsogenes TaxID=67365 RepID=UPI00331AC130